MRDYVIFTDSTSDLTPAECEKYGIWPDICMQGMTCGGKDVNFSDTEAFYANMENGLYPPGELKTSAPTRAEVERVLDGIIEKANPCSTIVYAGVTAHISEGTVNVVNGVMNEYKENYPNFSFVYIDTMSISNGQAVFLQYLAKYKGDDILGYAEKLRTHIVHLFTERDLRYSMKSGRYNLLEQAKILLANTLHFSPWMYCPSYDKLCVGKQKIRGDKILHEWVDYFMEHRAEDTDFIRIGYGGPAELPRAQKFIRLFKERTGFTDEQIQLTHTSPIVGAHTGSTVLSFFFKQRDDR